MAGKAYKKKNCRTCKKRFTPFRRFQVTCSLQCALEEGRKQKEKKRQRQHREDKERIKTLSEWKRDAQRVFNQYIRLRDAAAPCISCQRLHAGQYHAGHYRSTGAAPELRFMEDNCHKQCAPCNNHLSGNAIDYRINLIKKIGLQRVEWLEGPHPPKRYRIDELKDIIVLYKQKIKDLKVERAA